MDAQVRLDLLVSEHREVFVEAARQLKQKDAWDLSAPCVVVDSRKSPSISTIYAVGTLGSVISTSNAIDTPELRKWLEIAAERGAEAAFAEMFNDPDEEVGARFAEAYDELRAERAEGRKGLWSATDLSKFVVKTREAFPGSVACVALIPGEGDAKYGILTFESAVEALLR